MTDSDIQSLTQEIVAVKRLLVLQLLMNGSKQKDIALMLGISQATMSRMIPKGLELKAIRSKEAGT